MPYEQAADRYMNCDVLVRRRGEMFTAAVRVRDLGTRTVMGEYPDEDKAIRAARDLIDMLLLKDKRTITNFFGSSKDSED